ncbi:hypothetical protein LCGC14_1932400, partial [marine sediment metagenome]
VPGTYSLPSLGHFVTLREAGGAPAEYKVEKVEHEYTYKEVVNARTGDAITSLDAYITVTVSVVV